MKRCYNFQWHIKDMHRLQWHICNLLQDPISQLPIRQTMCAQLRKTCKVPTSSMINSWLEFSNREGQNYRHPWFSCIVCIFRTRYFKVKICRCDLPSNNDVTSVQHQALAATRTEKGSDDWERTEERGRIARSSGHIWRRWLGVNTALIF